MEPINTSKYEKVLKNCHLFNNLDKESYNELLSRFHEEKWPKSTCVLNQEKWFHNFYIILSGRVKMYQVDPKSGKEITLFLLAKSDSFDLFCLLDGCEHTVFYESLDSLKVLAIPMVDLREWLNKNPQHYLNLLNYAGKQMRLLENFVSDISFSDIPTRLIKLLIRNVKEDSNNLELINDLPNKEIANLIGSTRAVVNRHLQYLKKCGAIEISRSHVKIKNISLLQRLLELQKFRNPGQK
ncbi:MAG: Crp/Fnr family transcriptional regulator [Flavobacteriaceae bacterium]|nr:Crp/Fnr family transcriptional regulator [Flavobacteriaceae bacterium]